MKQRDYLFIVVCGNAVGHGHLRRSLTLAQVVSQENFGKAEILVITLDDYGDDHIFNEKDFQIKQARGFENLEYFMGLYNFDVIVCDVNHNSFFKSREAIKALGVIRKNESPIVWIDSLGEASILGRYESHVDLVLRPYVCGENKLNLRSKTSIIEGPSFTILPPEFRSPNPSHVTNQVSKILLTFGGSDPKELTIKVLRILNSIKDSFSIKVVIGPYFSEKSVILIDKFKKESKHSISIVRNPNSMGKLMSWADVAISSNGLTKYELASYGVPSILLSIDREHDLANEAFAKTNTAINLCHNASDFSIESAIRYLINDKDFRQKISDNGLKLLDGKGAQRVIRVINEELLEDVWHFRQK